jgi:hypothetical protein
MMFFKQSVFRVIAASVLITVFPVLSAAQSSGQFDLAGYHMTDPVATSAVGMAEVIVKGDSLMISGYFEDLTGPYWSAYIHYGAPGETGNRLLKLHAEVSEDQREGQFNPDVNAFKMSEAVHQALREGNLYLLISSHRFRQGEIRGQIPPLQGN